MTLLKRLKNLWNLSEWEIPKKEKNPRKDIREFFMEPEKPKMAQIIRRTNPTEDFLRESNE